MAEQTAKSKAETAAALERELQQIEENMRTLVRVTTTRYPVAQTPKEVIWTLNKAQLYRYVPPPGLDSGVARRHRVPLLLIFALINRPYILDLRPGNSFVEYMLRQGYDVYLLDWGAPGYEDRNLRFDDYVLDYLWRAVRKVKAVSGAETISMLGWCIGAILATSYAALRPADIKNLILLTAPLDFSNKELGGFTKWVAEEYLDVDQIIEQFGNMPGELIDYGAKALKPVESYIVNYVRLFDNLDNPKIVESWHAMNTWVSDIIPMSGALYKQLIGELYRQNRLAEGTWALRGEPVKLSNVRANLLNVIAEADHITPPCQSESVMGQAGSADKTLLRVPGGHIGIMAGSGAVKGTWPKIDAWLGPRSS